VGRNKQRHAEEGPKIVTKAKTVLFIGAQANEGTWPKAVLDPAGAFPEFPSLKEIRKGYAIEVRRGPKKKIRTDCGK
jgi:hypothetical protein